VIADPESSEAPSFTSLARQRPAPLFLFPIVSSTPDIEAISQSPRRYHARIADMAHDLESETRTTLFVMPSLGLAERVTEMLAEYSTTAELLPSMGAKALQNSRLNSNRIVTVGKLANGFALPAAGLSVLTESDVFGDVERAASQRVVKKARKKRTAAAFLSDLGDLKLGDYVVHVDHGVGQFQGLVQIATAGGTIGSGAPEIQSAAA